MILDLKDFGTIQCVEVLGEVVIKDRIWKMKVEGGVIFFLCWQTIYEVTYKHSVRKNALHRCSGVA